MWARKHFDSCTRGPRFETCLEQLLRNFFSLCFSPVNCNVYENVYEFQQPPVVGGGGGASGAPNRRSPAPLPPEARVSVYLCGGLLVEEMVHHQWLLTLRMPAHIDQCYEKQNTHTHTHTQTHVPREVEGQGIGCPRSTTTSTNHWWLWKLIHILTTSRSAPRLVCPLGFAPRGLRRRGGRTTPRTTSVWRSRRRGLVETSRGTQFLAPWDWF